MTHWRKRLVDLAGVTAITVIVWLWASGQTLQRRIIALPDAPPARHTLFVSNHPPWGGAKPFGVAKKN